MDLAMLMQKVYDLIKAVRAGDYMTAMFLVLEIVKAIVNTMPAAAVGRPRGGMHAVDYESKTVEELADDLESLVKSQPACSPGVALATAAAGPFIDNLLPILLALLKKWLGI